MQIVRFYQAVPNNSLSGSGNEMLAGAGVRASNVTQLKMVGDATKLIFAKGTRCARSEQKWAAK